MAPMNPVIRGWIFVLGILASVTASSWGQTGIGPEQARERIAELRAEIAHHDELYFKRATPEISDFAYDQLKRELSELESDFPGVAAGIPSPSSLGDDRSGDWPTSRHIEPMRGLEKTYAEAELRAFDRRIAQQLGKNILGYVIEPKVDGIAINITYENGHLVRAVTRGNGIEGDDITANALTILSLPHDLQLIAPYGLPNPIPELVELRGEIHLTLAEFARINDERAATGEPEFAHPRNLAAGTAKLLDSEAATTRHLDIVFFGLGACQPTTIVPATHGELRELMANWGLPVVTPASMARGGDELWQAVQALQQSRHGLPYPTDGVVVKLDSMAGQRALGATDEAPRWAMAFKFAPDRAETNLLAITIQVGRTGVLTPVAELDPVELAGSTVARASLHNRDAIARLDLRMGDRVFVEKAGGIIPEIVGVKTSQRAADAPAYVFPSSCPACGTAVQQSDDTAAVYCPSAACPAQLIRRLEHFASSECVTIDGLGPALIDVLVSHGWVRNIADIYQLRRTDLMSLGDNVATSTDALLAAIERSKHVELRRLIHGLSIRGVGAVTARRLAGRFGTLDALATASLDELQATESVGASTAAGIRAFFAAPQNRTLVSALRDAGVDPVAPRTGRSEAGPLEGKVFVLTGTLPTLTRTEAVELITAAGGVVRDDVSANTDYLVVGKNPGTKLGRARALEVETLDEASLRKRLRRD